ncbi:MAG: hemerythrin domain-containing protein [Gammaproteobacteria bacterium]|nr:hemerythrin domain-containing protein [Gammaproteobacteria bacterium]MCW8987864.1 hemerythrin domain-containing protein [Gammaproteobacteria bacterium]MCW9032335.1 hemerythrin domain-containing protein [Gammaproteobacteria bacterium]
MSISDHMTSEHKRCDLIYLAAEKAALEGDWNKARQEYQKFHQSMKQHFDMEEKVLFPDFEEVQGSNMGPTHVMRLEHEQMHTLLDNIQTALDAEDKDEFMGEADTLLMFMQQHNAKEEMMLYPMSDQVLAPQTEQIISRMQALVAS